MNDSKRIEQYALEMEGVFCNFFKSSCSIFGTKADVLEVCGWKKPILIALGCLYGRSNSDENAAQEIDNFLGEEIKGTRVLTLNTFNDVMEYFDREEDAYEYIERLIHRLRELLNVPRVSNQ